MSTVPPLSARGTPSPPTAHDPVPRAGFGPTLALTATAAIGALLVLMAVVLLVVHPETKGLGAFAGLVNQQNQKAKTFLYAMAFVVVLPVAVLAVPRRADAIAAGPSGPGLPLLAAILTGSLAGVLIVLRALGSHGLKAVLLAVIVWWLVGAALLARASSPRPWPALLRWRGQAPRVWLLAGIAVLTLLVALTARASLHPVPLILGTVIAVGIVAVSARVPRETSGGRRIGLAVDLLAGLLLVLAIPNLVIFHTVAGQLPSIYIPPGLYQNQQDYLLGSVNQLLGGGALLVNVPVSQYGVGLVYFLAGWFHLAPIGYGTLGFLDGILTALFYLAAYAVLRIAGVRRPFAVGALTVAVIALIFGLRYPVGALPETGPLRFGLPIAFVLARVIGVRWPARERVSSALSFAVIGLSAVWAFEAFTYTVLVFAVIVATQSWLRPAPARRRWIARQVGLAAFACVVAHVVLALATLAGTGHLPDWGHYLAYLRSFLLGGEAGAISYGFARWSPGLAFAGAVLICAAALTLLIRRAPASARGRPVLLLALAGTTAYAVGLLSYFDNRSSTYLIPYVALPLLLAATLWLELLWEVGNRVARRGGLAFALAVGVLLITAAWPWIGSNLSESALAHAYPGGGMGAAVHRLWHPPPIDPRAPTGEDLLRRYVPGRRVMILLPTVPDLGVEILMRSHRVNSLFIGDPVDDSLVFDAWKTRLRAELARLRPGQRLLTDTTAFAVLAGLRAHPATDPSKRPILGGDQEIEWLLREIDRRFALRVLARGSGGLIVAELVPR